MTVELHRIAPVSGAAMDRPITKPTLPKWLRWCAIALGLAAVGTLLYLGIPRGLTVPKDDLTLSTVSDGEFRDELVLRAQVEPAHQVLLDATDGGRVDAVLVRDGDMLKAGTLLYRLSNPQREQEVLQRSSEVALNLANLASQRTALANARALQRRDLTNLVNAAEQAQADLARQQHLVAQGFVSAAAVDDALRKRNLQSALLKQAQEDGATELRTREQAVTEMERAVKGLSDGLLVVRQAAAGLSARAPRDGQLSGFSLQVGGSVKPGDRLGRIDDIASFKLTGNVDEYYLQRVQTGLAASLETPGKTWPMKVSQRLPQVKEGRFGVEMEFTDGMPPGLQAGQSLDARIVLGQPGKARLINDGPFYADTGGNWVFVVDAAGKTAERRAVRLGRRAAGRIEVLEGLAPGERVITSKVRQFGDATVLNIKS